MILTFKENIMMKRNKLLTLLVFSLVLTVSLCILPTVAKDHAINTNSMSPDEYDQRLGQERKVKSIMPMATEGFYEDCLKKAPTEQARQQIEALKNKREYGGYYTRECLILSGQLPENQPRVTLKFAQELAAKHYRESQNNLELKAVAGAPDWEGGSGIYTSLYYLDDSEQEVIVSSLGCIEYAKKDENGNYQFLNLTNPELNIPTSSSPRD